MSGGRDIARTLASLVLAALATAVGGCVGAKKPYANDPLLRNRRAVIANPIPVPPADSWERPQPPPPP